LKPLLLVGGGGHCRAVIDVIEAASTYSIVGIVQRSANNRDSVMGYPVVGTDFNLPELIAQWPNSLVTVGQIKSPEVRVRLYELLKAYGGTLPIIKSPYAYCSQHAQLEEGTVLMHGSIVNANAYIGSNCIVNSQALIEHDAEIADCCHISTGARVNGGVRIGKGAFIGSGAILKEGIEVGEGAIIGAGQVVLRDVSAGVILRGHFD